MPDAIDDRTAAAVMMQGLTASHFATDFHPVQPGDVALVLFSATLPRAIVALARQYLKDAFRIEAAGSVGGHADIEYRAIRIRRAQQQEARGVVADGERVAIALVG